MTAHTHRRSTRHGARGASTKKPTPPVEPTPTAATHEYAESEDADAAERHLRRALAAIDDLRIESLSGGLCESEAKIVRRLADAITHARFFIRAFRYDVAHNYERVAANKNGNA